VSLSIDRQTARRRKSFRAGGIACCLAAILLSRALGAEPQPSTVILTFDASSEAQKQAIAAIKAHVRGLPAEIVVIPVEHEESLAQRLAASGSLAASRDALGTLYIQFAEDGALLIFFTEPDGEATLIRRLPANRQGARVAFEQAAIVARSLIEALIDGGRVGLGPEPNRQVGSEAEAQVDSEEAEATSSTDRLPDPPEAEAAGSEALPAEASRGGAPSDSASDRQWIAVTGGYTLTHFAAGLPWQSGFSAGFHWVVTPRFYAGARYTFFPALSAGTDDAVVSIKRYPIEAVLGYRGAGDFALHGEVGMVADHTLRTTVRTSSAFRATSPESRWMFAFAARAGACWSPVPRFRVALRGGADFVLTRYSYRIESGAAAPSPDWVRPRMELELAVALF
jgi:hypothetical protein